MISRSRSVSTHCHRPGGCVAQPLAPGRTSSPTPARPAQGKRRRHRTAKYVVT